MTMTMRNICEAIWTVDAAVEAKDYKSAWGLADDLAKRLKIRGPGVGIARNYASIGQYHAAARQILTEIRDKFRSCGA